VRPGNTVANNYEGEGALLFTFENVENFNNLGSILNADNKMNVEIAGRIAKGNKAYYANSKLNKIETLKEKH